MKKRLMSLLLVCSMILSLFTGLSVTALAAGTGPAGVSGQTRRARKLPLVSPSIGKVQERVTLL